MPKPSHIQPLAFFEFTAETVNAIDPKSKAEQVLARAAQSAKNNEDDTLFNSPWPEIPEGKALRVDICIVDATS